jgi:hypothetical protein
LEKEYFNPGSIVAPGNLSVPVFSLVFLMTSKSLILYFSLLYQTFLYDNMYLLFNACNKGVFIIDLNCKERIANVKPLGKNRG